MMKSYLNNLLLASALACASCMHPAAQFHGGAAGSTGGSGSRTLSTDEGIASELSKWFDPLMQRSFPGWVRTEPLVFDDLFWELHAGKAEQWRNPYNHGADVISDYEAAWERDLAVFRRIFPHNGPSYGLSVERGGGTPRIVWSHDPIPPSQPDLPFEVKFQNPSSQNPPGHHVPTGRVLRVDDGWLVCHNDGEFGAWLYWYGKHGENRYEVAPWAWVNGFFRFAGKLFAIGGLSQSGDSGTVFELAKVDGRWQAVKTIQLAQEAHLAAPMSDTSFIVVCTATLVEVSLDGSVRYLYGLINTGMTDGSLRRSASWLCHSPNSVVAHSGKVWIGTTFGVVVVTLRGWNSSEYWLVPEGEIAQIEQHFGHPWQPRIPTTADEQSEQEPANQ